MLQIKRYPLHIYISTLFIGLLLAFAAVIITMQNIKTRAMMLSAASEEFRHIDREISGAISARYDVAVLLAEFYSRSGLVSDQTLSARPLRLAVMSQFLRALPSVSAIYAARDNGDFFLGRPMVPGSPIAQALNAPPTARYLYWHIAHTDKGTVDSHFLFIDNSLNVVEDRSIPNETYDPRTRPWYQSATRTDDTVVTSPYRFFTTQEIGTTVAKRSADGHAIAAVDITLASFSDLLRSVRPTPSSELVIFDEQRRIVADASSDTAVDRAASAADLPRITATTRPVLNDIIDAGGGLKSGTRTTQTTDHRWDGAVSRVDEPGPPIFLAVAAPQSELLAEATKIRNESMLVTIVAILFAIALTLICSRAASRPLRALTREAAQIRELKFDRPIVIHSLVTEIDALASSMATMKSTIQRFLALGAALAGERNFDHLLERLLSETVRLASARGGAIYLAEPHGLLKCALAELDGRPASPIPPDVDPQVDCDHPVARAVAGNRASYVTDKFNTTRYPSLAQSGELIMLAVPLRNRQDQIVGCLTLIQEQHVLKDAQEQEILALVEALSGTAAAAIDSQRLIIEQKRLLEAVIELVADAIDRKSPYTGGHCQRVPELTKMIARAAEATTEGPFRDFTLTEDQWEELHIAAWLHDCGKVTTPEYVIDKATKLETIYDRIHEVRMRFEVLKREAEIICWREIADGAPRGPRLAELHVDLALLDDEFAFVANCNIGGESMRPDAIRRLNQIAQREWTRTLDDRLGISYEERLRKERMPAPPLPVREPVLADKPEHLTERLPRDGIDDNNPWGFKVEVPSNLYNRGEVYNLSIGRGTLTPEDRFKINEHIIETIRMLSRLPLPRHLGNVVEIAGGHHEKMDGTGYPRRLRQDEMSIPARIMAIADIFEALTAFDRPYKQSKTLTESLAIMGQMRDASHIDADLFDLFLSAEIYQAYAERFLDPRQVDAVDPTLYRRRAEAG